jgi:hypothetical protein
VEDPLGQDFYNIELREKHYRTFSIMAICSIFSIIDQISDPTKSFIPTKVFGLNYLTQQIMGLKTTVRLDYCRFRFRSEV